MPRTGRTFRVFVSSTFSDLAAERNALQEYVFPRLRELALAHGCRFQAIDLRWGVSEEAGLNQQAMKICLTEIARCQQVSPRPNFIILLGDRFGWRPLPYEIPAAEFERLLPLLTGAERALATGWYRRDDNAVPPQYVLNARQRGTPCEAYEHWEHEVERPLLAGLERAGQAAGLSPDAMVKYSYSATGPEIVRGALADAGAAAHVYAFFRNLLNPAEAGSLFAESDFDLRRRQEMLKAELRGRLHDNIHDFPARWFGGSVTQTHTGSLPETLADCLELNESGAAPANLCEAVWLRLSRVMLAEIAHLDEVDPLQAEMGAHAAFAEERARGFAGREGLLDAVAGYLRAGSRMPLVVWGESGSGKSALMAAAAGRARQAHPDALVLARFLGATSASTSTASLLAGLCREIARGTGADAAGIPTRYNELIGQFLPWLARTTAARPLFLFIDALEQLSGDGAAASLAWLPAVLPPHVSVIVSTVPGDCLDELRHRAEGWVGQVLEVPPLDPATTVAILDGWLAEADRRLTGAQRAALLAGAGCSRLPIYLKLAFEQAVRWRSFDPVPALPYDVAGVTASWLTGLEDAANHGRVLVSRVLGLLAVARSGLAEDELLDVLWEDKAVQADFFAGSPKSPRDAACLPAAVWARLFADLEPYLATRTADSTDVLSFYHSQLRQVAGARYAAGSAGVERCNALAAYFERQPWALADSPAPHPNERKLAELPYARLGAGDWVRLMNVLCSPEYFIGYNLVHRGDYQELMRYWMAVKRQAAGDASVPGATVKLSAGEIYRRAWAPLLDRPEYAAIAGELGAFLLEIGEPEEAGFFTKIEETAAGTDPYLLAANLNDQGLNASRRGDYAAAGEHYRQALALLEAAGSSEAAATCVNLADAYLDERRFDEARRLLDKAQALRQAQSGERSAEAATVLQAFGNLADREGKPQEALDYHLQALEMRRGCLGERHVDTGRSLFNVALMRFRLKQFCESRRLLQQSRAILDGVWTVADNRLAPVRQLAEASDRLARLTLDKPARFGIVLPVLSTAASTDALRRCVVSILDDLIAHEQGAGLLLLLPAGAAAEAGLATLTTDYGLPAAWLTAIRVPPAARGKQAGAAAQEVTASFGQWVRGRRLSALVVMPAAGTPVDWPLVQHVLTSGKPLVAEIVPAAGAPGPLLGVKTVGGQRKTAFMPTEAYRRQGYAPQPADKLGDGIFYISVDEVDKLLVPPKGGGGLFGRRPAVSPVEQALREAGLTLVAAAGNDGAGLLAAYEAFFCTLVDLLGAGLIEMSAGRAAV